MNKNLQAEIETMGYKSQNVKVTTEADQDFLIMSKLLRLTKTVDFEPDELEYYQWISEHMEECHFARGRIQTPDFTEEELLQYKWAAEHPTGSCRGFRFTEEPTEEEIKEWQESLEFLDKLDFAAVRARVKFYDREDEQSYSNDNKSDKQWHAWCNLGNDPYSQRDECW